MLIDDDKDDCEIFCDAAHEVSNCKCHCVNDSVEALSILERTRTFPHCIFLDINIPVMDGVTVLKKIKANPKLSEIPIIMYSTTSNPLEMQECLQLGADKFVRKTSNYLQLVASLKAIKSEILNGK